MHLSDVERDPGQDSQNSKVAVNPSWLVDTQNENQSLISYATMIHNSPLMFSLLVES